MKKKVLVISEIAIFPVDRGNKSYIFGNLTRLRELGYEIFYLYYCGNNRVGVKGMQHYFGKEHLFLFKDIKRTVKDDIKSLFRSKIKDLSLDQKFIVPYHIDEWVAPSLSDYVEKLNQKFNFDIVWCEYVMFSKAFCNLPSSVVKVISAHDKFADRHKIFLQSSKAPQFFYTSKKQEKKGLSRADIIFAIQSEEKKYFKKLVKSDFVYTLGAKIRQHKAEVVNSCDILFIGTDYEINVMAIQNFIYNVLPLVKKRNSNINLLLAGSICNKIENSSQYKKLGYVRDLESLYNSVRLVINPVLSGTGLNIKTIEALEHSKPLVSTSVGVKGLPKDKGIFAVADTKERFADAILKIVADDTLAFQYAYKASRFVTDYNKKNKDIIVKVLRLINSPHTLK